MNYLRNNNIKIGSIFLFCILAIVIVNPSIAQESPVILNSSHDPAMLRNISHIDSTVGTVTHRYPPGITMGNIPPDRLNNLSRVKNNLGNNVSNRTLYLFSWDDIPGNDTGRLITILKNVYRIEWAKTAKIEKIDGGKTILVSTEIKSLSLKLNDEKTKVNLAINDNRTDEFIVRMNNNKLNIYKNFMAEPAQAGLFSRNNNQSGRITGNAYFVPKPQIPPVKSRNRFDITSLKSEHKPRELLVKYTKKLPKKDFENFYTSQNITLIKDYPKIGYHLIRVDESRLENTMEELSLSDIFEDAEPNFLVKALKTPNDPRFNELWAMNNTGQTGGTPDADIDAPQAWDISTGYKEVIVAVIDTGVDYTHEDLAGNMWINPGEIQGNGIDDDNNGFVDDYYGWDFAYDDNDPMDGNSHGTHVSGTIGGVGNNGKGVAGVSWNTNIMAVKFLDDYGSGYTSDAIDAINYATIMGADIMSNSWGGGEYSSALEAAIQAADNAGILFVAASGNWAEDTDQYPNYPSGYDVPNVMSIAATDKNDNLASFSNYGASTVDMGAPGVDILSSVPGNGYYSYNGTSMAAPHVSGAAALLKAFNPSLTYLDIKEILMNSVDPLPSLYGKTVTGGRLNIQNALTFALTYSTVCQSGCNYRSIQSAIDAANPGNTIIVRSGTYYENVVVNKQLIMRGIGMPVVDARGSGSAITLTVNGIRLEGFTVTGGASYPEVGVKVSSNDNTLRDNNVSNNSYGGIFLSSSSNNTINGNIVSNNGYSGVILSSSINNLIYNNIFNNTNNVNFYGSNVITWNIIRQSGSNIINGLYLGGNFWAKPDGSGFSQTCDDGNGDGICDSSFILDSTNFDYLPLVYTPAHNINKGTNYPTIQSAINDASPGDEIHVDNGIYFENLNVNKQLTLRGIGMPVVDARGNGSAITLAANGIILEGFTATRGASDPEAGIKIISNNNTLRDNIISNNSYGGIVLESSRNNMIYNNIFNNTENVQIINSNINKWNITKQSRTNIIGGLYLGGNFWAKPDGSGFSQKCDDDNLDGICESAYILDSTNIDYLPFSTKGPVHNINKGTNYTSIQVAINDASPGNEIHVDIGTYYENVYVDKQLTLRGVGIPVVNAGGGGSAITLAADGITLEGFTATGGGEAGIKVISNNNMLINNDASSNGYWQSGIGIFLYRSNNNTLISNNASANNAYYGASTGIYLYSSGNNTLSNNNASSNIGINDYGYQGYGYGIWVDSSTRNVLKNNIMKGNDYNFGLEGNSYSDFDNQIDTTNMVDRKPVYYVKGVTNTVYDSDTNAGTFYCINCVNVTLKNLDLKTNANGIFFWNTTHSKIQNVIASNNYRGISLSSSSNNILIGNNASNNSDTGISLSSSSNNTLSGNNANSNPGGVVIYYGDYGYYSYVYGYGISLSSSNNNTLSSNNANSNSGSGDSYCCGPNYGYGYGISLSSSNNNTLIGNNANSNSGFGFGDHALGFGSGSGISLSSSNNNTLSSNTANSNSGYGYGSGMGSGGFGIGYGILLSSSSNNTLNGNNANSNSGEGYGSWDGYGTGTGVHLSSSSNNTLNGNIANSNYGEGWGGLYSSGFGSGISLSSSTNNKLIGNTANLHSGYSCWDAECNISGNGILLSSSNNMLRGNNVSNNNFGISLSSYNDYWNDIYLDSSNNMLSGNNASNNYIGISLSSSSKNMISGNDANSNNVGISLSRYYDYWYDIYLESSSNNTLSGNNVSNNNNGISLGSSTNNTLIGNNAWNNSNALFLLSSTSNTLLGNNATSNSLGIFLNSSNFNNITSNDISNSTSVGIKVSDASINNTVSRNRITNSTSGMFLVYSFNTTASNNIMENNSFNFGVGGNLISNFDGNNIETTNLANGRPIYYVKYAKNTIYDGSIKASTFYCILCNNVTVKDLEMSNMDRGVYFWETSNSRIQNITVKQSGWGIFMRNSSNNSIKDSKFSTNNLQDYSETGVSLYSSDNNTFENNTFSLNKYGIELSSSSKNTIYNNYFNNTNNFIFRVITYNIWNTTKKPGTNIIGGPYLGGNFWASPSGTGISQTCSDSNIDGLCDLKYSLNTINVDNLPLKYKSALGITVVSPNGGENWNRGTTHIINWTSTGSPGAYVKIELLKGGVWKSYIISSTLNDGSHPWLIPATLAPGNDYKIKITSTTNTAYTDTSEDNFTIPVPIITVLSPNGTDIWTRGTTKTIKWNSSGSPGAYVKIELLKGGVLNRVIVSSTLNDGSHPWLIPAMQAPGTDYKVKITSTTNVAYNDTSDSSFTIPVPSFKVISPNGPESWIRGTTQIIRWNSTESPGTYVKIELMKPGKLNQLIISATLNDGSHPWLIPALQAPGSDYKVKITSTINASNSDTSDDNFTIPTPSSKVISPNDPVSWIRGTTQTIKWNSTENPKGYVKIELLKPGKLNQLIISATLNDGSHPWLIPAAQAPGTDYKVKITSTANLSNNDISDNNFTIPVPSYTVVSPIGGENWTRGTTRMVNWTSTENPKGYVKIELLKAGVLNRVILLSTLNDGSQTWTIPTTQIPGSDYKIRISSTINPAYTNSSKSNFSISS